LLIYSMLEWADTGTFYSKWTGDK